jgi:hypothetical protein
LLMRIRMTDQQYNESHHRAEINAVAELVPEIFEIPVALGQDDPEAVGGRFRRPEMIAEHVALGLEGHHYDVVDRRERPHQQDGADDCDPRIGQVAPAPRGAPHPLRGASRG